MAFEAWTCITTAVFDPSTAGPQVEQLLPRAMAVAHQPHDFASTILLIARALCASRPGSYDTATAAARQAVAQSRPGGPAHHSALALLPWLSRITGRQPDRDMRTLIEHHRHRMAVFSTVGVAAAVCSDQSVDVRARALRELAGRRPLGRFVGEEAQFLVGFAHLALDEGDEERARTLASVTLPTDAATGLALTHLQASLEAWSALTWTTSSSAMMGRLLTLNVGDVTAQARSLLTDELARWDHVQRRS